MDVDRPRVVVDETDPRERGRRRGEALASVLPASLEVYDRLFALGGLAPQTVRDDAERTLDAVAAFRPALAGQIAGIAEGAGVDLWRIAALNARTEILAGSAAVSPGECSTIVRDVARAGGTRHPLGVQTWDWHVELRGGWHLVESGGARHRFVGITEHGILAKIGVNSAGLGLHFNILHHADDRAAGVPVHALAAAVLEEAATVAAAHDLIRSATVTSSSSFTLLDSETATVLDVSPVGVFEAPPLAPGTWLRTNSFLTPVPAAGERPEEGSDSVERYDLLRDRLAGAAPADGDALLATLVTGPGEPKVTCTPDAGMPLGRRWATLATIVLDPLERTARVLDGTPAERETGDWYELRA